MSSVAGDEPPPLWDSDIEDEVSADRCRKLSPEAAKQLLKHKAHWMRDWPWLIEGQDGIGCSDCCKRLVDDGQEAFVAGSKWARLAVTTAICIRASAFKDHFDSDEHQGKLRDPAPSREQFMEVMRATRLGENKLHSQFRAGRLKLRRLKYCLADFEITFRRC